MSKRLFDLSLEDKMKAPHPEGMTPHPEGMTPHRGYSGFGRERGGATGPLDTEERGIEEEEGLRSADYKVRF